MEKKLFEEKIDSKTIFRGEIVELYLDRVKLPDGKIASREKVTHPGAVGIVPVINKKIILVKQFRYPVSEVTFEIPAGKLNAGEPMHECARRELQEEIGAVNGKLIHLTSFFTTPGFCNELLHLYLALDFEKKDNNLDDDEFLEIVEFSFDQVLKMIETGDIKDSKTIIGILLGRDYINKKYKIESR